MAARGTATGRENAVGRQNAVGRLPASGRLNVDGSGGLADMQVLGRTRLVSGDLTTASGTFGNVSGAAVTCVTGAVSVIVIVECSVNTSNIAADMCLELTIDTVAQGGTHGLCISSCFSALRNSAMCFTYSTAVLSAASHTFQLQARTTAGTMTMFASAVTPLIITVVG